MGILLIVGLFSVGNIAVGPTLMVLSLAGAAGLALITIWPQYAVAGLLSSFLLTYPAWARVGPLTINNFLGLWLVVIIIYRLYIEGDWWFLHSTELRLLLAITAVYLLSRLFHQPDHFKLALVGTIPGQDQDPARIFIGRTAFLFFMVYLIRSPKQGRMLFVLAMTLAIATGVASVWRVLSGSGWMHGYRASSALIIQAAGNPNRMAMFCCLGIITLWYLVQAKKQKLWYFVAAPVIPALVLAIFMSASRSGVAGLLLTTLLLGMEGGITARKIVLGVIAGLAGAILVIQATPEKSLERITMVPGTKAAQQDSLGRRSYLGRTYAAQVALELAGENPVFGVGIGNWSPIRFLEDPTRDTTPPHSSYLRCLAEGGLVTLGLYLLLFRRVLRNFGDMQWLLSRGHTPSANMLWMIKSLRMGFIILLAFSAVGDIWLDAIFYLYLGLGILLPRLLFAEAELEAEATA